MNAKTPKPTKTPKAPRVLFVEPDATLARIWRPADAWEREVLTEALLPTLRRYADALAGLTADPPPGDVVYATREGLRHYLLHDLRRDRPFCAITPEMAAFAWHTRLSPLQRATLAEYAAIGVVVQHWRGQPVSAMDAQPALFAAS